MNVAEALFLIVLMVLATSIVLGRQYYAAEERKRTGGREPEDDRLREEVRYLRERVAVLERVVTDQHGSHDLDREIERLRDR